MKLENPGYRLGQRQEKNTRCGNFEWEIRLQLSQCYSNICGLIRTPKIHVLKSNQESYFKKRREDLPLITQSDCKVWFSKEHLPEINVVGRKQLTEWKVKAIFCGKERNPRTGEEIEIKVNVRCKNSFVTWGVHSIGCASKQKMEKFRDDPQVLCDYVSHCRFCALVCGLRCQQRGT